MTEPTGWARGEVIGAIGVVVGVLAIWAWLAIYFAAALRDPDDREHLKSLI